MAVSPREVWTGRSTLHLRSSTPHATRRQRRVACGVLERIAQARALLLKLEQLWISRFSQVDKVLSDTNTTRE